jgi:flagellar biosynthesis component FlhA
MNTHINHKIYGIVEEIKLTEEMIVLHQNGDDPADEIMEKQFRIKKSKLMRELLSELALSGLSIKNTKGIIQRLATYIEKTEEPFEGKNEDEYEFSEIEKLMAV